MTAKKDETCSSHRPTLTTAAVSRERGQESSNSISDSASASSSRPFGIAGPSASSPYPTQYALQGSPQHEEGSRNASDLLCCARHIAAGKDIPAQACCGSVDANKTNGILLSPLLKRPLLLVPPKKPNGSGVPWLVRRLWSISRRPKRQLAVVPSRVLAAPLSLERQAQRVRGSRAPVAFWTIHSVPPLSPRGTGRLGSPLP